MATPRTGLPSFWSTHIAKVLVGENPCLLQPWLQGHLEFAKRQRDQGSLAKWKADHTEQLQKQAEMYRRANWKCDVERFFRVTGQHAILSGKADLIAQKDGERPLILDVKSGQPRDSDVAQVIIEMCLIPLAWKAPTMVFGGMVVYPTYSVQVKPWEAEALKSRLFALLKQLGTMTQPDPSPGEHVCRFCDVPDDLCHARWTDPMETVLTEEF